MQLISFTVFGDRLRLALCCGAVVLSVCNVVVLWQNGCMDQDATSYRGRTWPRRHCVRWGPSSPTERSAQQPSPITFAVYGRRQARVCINRGPCLLCQTAGWIRMPVGTKVGLGTGDIVLD